MVVGKVQEREKKREWLINKYASQKEVLGDDIKSQGQTQRPLQPTEMSLQTHSCLYVPHHFLVCCQSLLLSSGPLQNPFPYTSFTSLFCNYPTTGFLSKWIKALRNYELDGTL